MAVGVRFHGPCAALHFDCPDVSILDIDRTRLLFVAANGHWHPRIPAYDLLLCFRRMLRQPRPMSSASLVTLQFLPISFSLFLSHSLSLSLSLSLFHPLARAPLVHALSFASSIISEYYPRVTFFGNRYLLDFRATRITIRFEDYR